MSSDRGAELSDAELDRLIARIAELRVGGSYWGVQHDLPASGYSLVQVRDPGLRQEALEQCNGVPFVVSVEPADNDDPWHLLSAASEAIVDADSELALIAVLAGVPVTCIGEGPFEPLKNGDYRALREVFRRTCLRACTDPFTGVPLPYADAVELCGFWRRLIDSNRDLTAAIGFGRWKHSNVAPLLWRSGTPVPFVRKLDRPKRGDRIVIWRSRVEPAALAQLEASGAELIEAEDGFIRSVGLGADCVPPLSIILDRAGIYFDPNQPSDLEGLIATGDFSAELLDRAKRLRDLITTTGISKYGLGTAPAQARRPPGSILVIGQVEDDRAVLTGGGPRTNIELLERVRELNPGAYLVYRPHPDVEAGHRRGAIPDEICLTLADEIARDASISSLIEATDEVHANTSLAGFEALLRGKPVTAYGAPFYAGWGLTRDRGPIPIRRKARRTIDELVSAALLLYPRYLDPLTRLPCPPEILVRRLADGKASAPRSGLVQLRRLQGRLRQKLPSFQGASR